MEQTKSYGPAVLAAYDAVLSFQKEALSLGLTSITSLDDDLFLSVAGHHIDSPLLFDVVTKSPAEIAGFYEQKVEQLRSFRKDRTEEIRKAIADLEEELANLEGRRDD